MRLLVIFILCAVGLFSKCSLADEENEVKRGSFPFMAFVYFSDKTIIDRTGARLTRGAVLIRPEWLISSSLEDGETSLAFPKETLVARLGAVRIDARFSVNEDEEEQEREIVQMASPFNYSATEWWLTDITLLKTLFPFNITSVVTPFAINTSPKATDKDCFILIYSALNGNRSEDKLLMKLSVDMLPSTPEDCGSNFAKSSMICAADSDGSKIHSNFCEGNSGSPLICENDVVGIQTYVNDCKPPHLFQHLKYWDNLISCAVEDKCHEEQCSTICNVVNKDPLEFPLHQQAIADAKVNLEEVASSSDIVIIATTQNLRRLLLDFKTAPDNDSNKSGNNTETTTSTSSTLYTTEKEIITSEAETILPTTTGETEEDQERSSSFASTPILFNTEIDTTHYLYKNDELVSKVAELKNLIEENGLNKSQINPEEHKPKRLTPSVASLNTLCPCILLSSLILFYLQFSSIVNSF